MPDFGRLPPRPHTPRAPALGGHHVALATHLPGCFAPRLARDLRLGRRVVRHADQATPAGVGVWGIATADFNGDGRLDVVTSQKLASTFTLNLGLGGGRLGPATDSRARFARRNRSRDVNGDGKADVVTVNTSNDVSLMIGNGNGTFAPHLEYATLQGATARSVVSPISTRTAGVT